MHFFSINAKSKAIEFGEKEASNEVTVLGLIFCLFNLLFHLSMFFF